MQVVSKYRISVIFKYFHLNDGKTFIVHYKYLHHAKLRSETKYRSDHDDEICVTYSLSKDYGTCLAGNKSVLVEYGKNCSLVGHTC